MLKKELSFEQIEIKKLNIGILDCGVIKEDQRHRAQKIQKILKNLNTNKIINQPIKTQIIKIIENEKIENLNNFTHIIITGSGYDYDKNLEGLNYLRTIIPKLKQNKTPTLGICFGAQILAHELGGKVIKQQNKQIGFSQIEIIQEHKIFSNISKNPKVFQYHFDHIENLPKEAILLAKTNCCNQAFILDNFIGIQFHPEIDHNFAKNEYQVIKENLIQNHNISEIEFTGNQPKKNEKNEIEQIFQNFLTHF